MWVRAELVMAIFVAAVLIWLAVPFSIWMKVGKTTVDDVVVGEPITLQHTGSVVRDFMGSYSAVVRRLPNHVPVCEGRGGPFTYKTGSQRPDPLTLEWWISNTPSCSADVSKIGTYVLETCWEVHLGPLSKGKCIESNPFDITAPDLGATLLLDKQMILQQQIKNLRQEINGLKSTQE